MEQKLSKYTASTNAYLSFYSVFHRLYNTEAQLIYLWCERDNHTTASNTTTAQGGLTSVFLDYCHKEVVKVKKVPCTATFLAIISF